MKIMTYYQLLKFDGGDRHIPSDVCFTSEEDMKLLLKGNVYDTYSKKSVYLYDTYDEYVSVTSEKTREAALKKLTDVEKNALGLI